MPRSLLSLLMISLVISSTAQVRIDSFYAFQTDPAKKYSIYVPSGYNIATPHKLMLGLHPLNTSRWDAESWCDTLTAFAEINNLLLVCPDGGPDGRIDDAIDTAFTTDLLDSMTNWYNVDIEKMYVMGFSWGGKATYTYGLSNFRKFGGFMPIGAAINGTSEVGPTLQGNAKNKAVFIVHGGNDSPNNRYWVIRDALIDSGAILNSILMPGVGHTIDFLNRNQILTDAYVWIDSVNCSEGPPTGIQPAELENIFIYPNPTGSYATLLLDKDYSGSYQISIVNVTGKVVLAKIIVKETGQDHFRLDLKDLARGSYFLSISKDGIVIKTLQLSIAGDR